MFQYEIEQFISNGFFMKLFDFESFNLKFLNF